MHILEISMLEEIAEGKYEGCIIPNTFQQLKNIRIKKKKEKVEISLWMLLIFDNLGIWRHGIESPPAMTD